MISLPFMERQLRDQGFVVIKGALTRRTVMTLNKRFSSTYFELQTPLGYSEGVLHPETVNLDPDKRESAELRDGLIIDVIRRIEDFHLEEILDPFHLTLREFRLIAKAPLAEAHPWNWHQRHDFTKQGPRQLALLYCLGDSAPDSACPRVIPNSHRQHEYELRRQIVSYYKMREIHPGEISVPLRPGDLLIMDGRLLHALHANRVNEWMSYLAISYFLDFDQYRDQAEALHEFPMEWWKRPESSQPHPRIRPLLPRLTQGAHY